MNDDPPQPARLRSNEALRLEGLVVEKRLGRVERTRYLVIDFNDSSISVYRSPPPTADVTTTQQRIQSRSLPSRLISSATSNFSMSLSTSNQGVRKAENLTHLSCQVRDFERGMWDPKFTVPSSMGWKIRDIENDETGFYLVLPPAFKKVDSKAQVLTCVRQGRRISYTQLSVPDSFNNIEDTVGSSGLESWGNSTRNASDDDDNNSVTTTASIKSKMALFRKTKRAPAGEQEVVYLFRVLLDGNEKFIWLQAAAELGRLSPEPAFLFNVPIPIDAVRKTIGFVRSNLTERSLRYAEWAQIIGKKQTVSKFFFNVHDTGNEIATQENKYAIDQSSRYNSTHLLTIKPSYAYPNRKMTERDLYREMMMTSDKWEDFRTQTVGDRDEEMIGSLHVEVLACHGLPKLDRFSGTDAVCYFVCGPFAFASDVIDGFLSPVWPRKSRRACIFPLFHAYQKLFVGVFDDDGAREKDDFAGRVVLDMARLRPNSVYDVFIPLRLYQNAYVRKARGAVHLRLRVEWNNERKALLSYLKLPTKTEQLGNAVTVNCSDYKAFRNVVLTVQGKDVPGRYKVLIQKALQREMKLYKEAIQTTMKALILDIINYAHPLMSLCVFFAWMHVVYSNSLARVPVYFVVGIIAFLLRNYIKYGVGKASEYPHYGFTPIKLSEIVYVLIFGGAGTRYLKPITVTASTLAATKSKPSFDELDGDEQYMLQQAANGAGVIRMDGDHMEFPFSEAGRYPKTTHLEAMGDAAALFIDDDDDEEVEPATSRKFEAFRREKKNSSLTSISIPENEEEEEEEEENENEDQFHQELISRSLDEQEIKRVVVGGIGSNDVSHSTPSDAIKPDKLWKRVKDPRGLPEQNAMVSVKATRTLKEEIVHGRNLLQKSTMRLFDDRLFIVSEYDPGHSTGRGIALNQAIGANKYKSPIVAKIAEYGAPGLECLKVGLSMMRAIFNIFLWRDPFLTSLFLLGIILLLCVMFVFPWRLFFFAVGFGAFGPQNWLVRVFRKKKTKKEEPPDDPSSHPIAGSKVVRALGAIKHSPFKDKRKGKVATYDPKTFGAHFRFHNHLTTANGIDVRAERAQKSAYSIHRAVVPNSPLLSRRFYDWPPNPSLSKVDIYSK